MLELDDIVRRAGEPGMLPELSRGQQNSGRDAGWLFLAFILAAIFAAVMS